MYNRKTLRCADLFYHSYDDNEDERGHGGEGRHGGRGQRQLDYLKKAKILSAAQTVGKTATNPLIKCSLVYISTTVCLLFR